MSKRIGKSHIHIEVDEEFKQELLNLLPEHGMVSIVGRAFFKAFVKEMKRKKQIGKSPLDTAINSTVTKMSSILPEEDKE